MSLSHVATAVMILTKVMGNPYKHPMKFMSCKEVKSPNGLVSRFALLVSILKQSQIVLPRGTHLSV